MMVSPVKGYLSSGYGTRNGVKHAGVDIATGGVAAPVYAAFGGTLSNIVRGRKRYQPASQGPVVAPGRSGDGGQVRNPDGERQVYIHVRFLEKWKNGDRVEAGDLLGYVNLSGNTSGYHLHFECWNKNGVTRNPLIDFRAFGLAVGETPRPPKKDTAPAKPKPTTPSKPKGYSKAVEDWQRRLNYYAKAGLYVDGVEGTVSKRWRAWVREAQAALNNYNGVRGKVVIDGDYGPKFRDQVKTVQRRNGLYPDGVIGPVMIAWMRRQGSRISNRPSNRP